MKSKRGILCLCAALVTFAAHASADDLFPPPWRGQPLTTYAAWDFAGPANPSLA